MGIEGVKVYRHRQPLGVIRNTRPNPGRLVKGLLDSPVTKTEQEAGQIVSWAPFMPHSVWLSRSLGGLSMGHGEELPLGNLLT